MQIPPPPPAIVQPAQRPSAATPVYPLAPALPTDSTLWLNTGGKLAAVAQGRVTVLTFWTADCINCKHTLPFWNTWAARFASASDIAVVSVHTPETRWERSPNVVRKAIKDHNLHFPVLIDNEATVFSAYTVNAWPTTIVIDKHGRIRGKWEGELNWQNSHEYQRVEQLIDKLRGER